MQHFTSSTALLTALRIQYEFSKIRRMRPAGVSMSHLGIFQGDGSGSADSASKSANPLQQAQTGAAVVATVAASDALEQGLMAAGGGM